MRILQPLGDVYRRPLGPTASTQYLPCPLACPPDCPQTTASVADPTSLDVSELCQQRPVTVILVPGQDAARRANDLEHHDRTPSLSM